MGAAPLMYSNMSLYLFAFFSALIMSLILTPAARAAAIVLDILDHPSTKVKTHKEPVPYLGGVAIFIAFTFALLWVRVLTSFPTGTLRSLRGILIGGTFIFAVGLVDDIRHHGLHYRTKFFFQISAALVVMLFGIRIHFVQPFWVAMALTIIWIVGVTNAFNLTDIMDGLASGIAAVAALAFLFISLPTEEIYVNFAAAALAGAVLGFFPYNTSKKSRIFMGDCGSLFLGFVASSLALGTSYGGKTEIGVFAPLVILALPIYDTILVFYLRIRKGMSPFLGSKDHYPLRMEVLGWDRKKILRFAIFVSLGLGLSAYSIAHSSVIPVILIYGFVLVFFALFTAYVLKAKIQ
jgi:UDP-GlcNAc:undecaprenyl-phosphate GlcNAc-1-phosphate transferase